MQEIIDVVSSLGFPIAVAAFALWNSYQHEQYLQNVLDNTLKENTTALEKLTALIDGRVKEIFVTERSENNENK